MARIKTNGVKVVRCQMPKMDHKEILGAAANALLRKKSVAATFAFPNTIQRYSSLQPWPISQRVSIITLTVTLQRLNSFLTSSAMCSVIQLPHIKSNEPSLF